MINLPSSLARRCGLAFAAGLLAALAFPPFNAIPVLWLSFPALFILTKNARNARQAFATGWCFSFGLLVPSLYWIAGALFVDIAKFWRVLPFAVAGLPAFFAFYYGLAAALAWRRGLARPGAPLFFALCWFLADLARGHLFTGFPWDITGYVWGDCLPVLQITHAIGIEGLTLLTLGLAFAPCAFFVWKRKQAVLLSLLPFLLFMGLAGWGEVRLREAKDTNVPHVRIRIVQPNTDQALKWKAENRRANLEKLIELSAAPAQGLTPTHIIWPETAAAYYLAEEPAVRREIARFMPSGSVLITGAVRRRADEEGGYHYYNSLIVMDSKADILGSYDKHHLVPFGEYMPFRSVLPLPVVSMLGTDFTAGEGVKTLRAPGLPPFSPLICYEAIFSDDVAARDDRPQFLLNLTNDAWYEGTIGPAQHFAIARVRAIEEGLPLIRAANKGISGLVDPWGRVFSSTDGRSPAFLDFDLPESLNNEIPLEIQGKKPSWLILFGIFLLGSVFPQGNIRIQRK